MNRYQKAQIYKIVSPDFRYCYIGSTCERLSQRMTRHRHQYSSHQKGKHGRNTSFEIFDNYGIDRCKIIWIEDCPCNSKKELEAREGYYIENTNCVNRRFEGRTKEPYREQHKERKKELDKEYRELHKEELKEKREEKKDYYNEYNKNWKANNKAHISQYNKEWNENNKEKRAEKTDCSICGSTIRKYDLKKHQQTKKCQSHLINQE